MYVRTVTRTNKSGSTTSYLQLASNQWDPVRKRSVVTVVANLGRVDQGGADQVANLAQACLRYLGTPPTDPTNIPEATMSRPAGGAWILDGIWRQVGLDKIITQWTRPGPGRKKNMDKVERILFGMVADRWLAPSSKLMGAEWMTQDVAIPGMVDDVSDDECYRAMDWLVEAGDVFARQVYDSVADLVNLEVDLVFFDTTSTYFETEVGDEPAPRDSTGMICDDEDAVTRVGFRTWGKSKDSRGDLPHIVVGMAVTRGGIPIRIWSWPGNTNDSALIRQARTELRDWTLSKVVWVADRGFSSQDNRTELMRGGDGYILGEKLRSGSDEAQAALTRPGRYRVVADNLQAKEVTIGATDRFVVCDNPDEAIRDEHTRTRLVARLEDMIDGSDTMTDIKRAELRGKISTMPGLNRFLRVTPTGLLRVDKHTIATEVGLDGKYLLRTSDPRLSTADIAHGYTQLLQVERGWRDMKSTLELRPVYHRLEDRIRAHVVLCWLALLLIRIIETHTGRTWNQIRREMSRLHEITYQTPDGRIRTHTTTTPAQQQILDTLHLDAPPRAAITPLTSRNTNS